MLLPPGSRRPAGAGSREHEFNQRFVALRGNAMLRRKILCAVASLSLATAGHAGTLCPWDCGGVGDGEVGINDFLVLLAQWGGPGCDFDGGGVGITDLLAMLAHWGPCPVGACCNPSDGGCQVQTPADCTAAGGVYGGGGMDCADSDFDRIPDVFELNTCKSAGPCFAGSNPNAADTDGDLILDGDEFYGTLDGLDLPAMGLDPCHKDLLIETDWVHTTGQPADRNKLHENQVNRLVASFAKSGIPNPDGGTGITLHIDYGQAPYGGGNSVQDPANNTMVDVDSFAFNSGEYFDIKDVHFAVNRHGYFHYGLMCDAYSVNGNYQNSSGLGELPGDDFIVSFGQWAIGNSNRIGNTVLHELGHNLALRHGGFENRNFKPNYNSVMNYWYQVCGADGDDDVDPDDITDYSHGVNIALSESVLIEADGVTGVGPGIDWNNNGDEVDTIDRNINCRPTNTFTNSSCNNVTRQPSPCGSSGQCYDSGCNVLSDYNDWAGLSLNSLSDGDFVPREVIHCLVDAPALIVGRDED